MILLHDINFDHKSACMLMLMVINGMMKLYGLFAVAFINLFYLFKLIMEVSEKILQNLIISDCLSHYKEVGNFFLVDLLV
jgi:hypothetical protein